MKLTIITINYNNLDGLTRTIESVVDQTWQDFEYIVIDGGSTDGSAKYIESQADKIDYWVSEPDSGIYNAMNKGIEKASGEYLFFLNSGDHFFSNTILKDNHSKIDIYDVIYFNIVLKDGKKSRILSYPEKLNFAHFYAETLCHQSTLIKKELFKKIGLYDETFQFVSDWKFFIIALFQFNCSYIKINQKLSVFYLDGISSDPENDELLYQERQKVLKADFSNLVDDLNELNELRRILAKLRKSKKLQLLVKWGLINKF